MARKTKKNVSAPEPGYYIPMTDFQREFLDVRGKFVNNPEMELAVRFEQSDHRRAPQFGQNPLPWEIPMTNQDIKHLEQAQNKKYKCKNPNCTVYNTEAPGRYVIVTHSKEIPHSEDSNEFIRKTRNQIDIKRFGRRKRTCLHVGVNCASCGQFIQYVKYSMAHRRAAGDINVSGPHHGRRGR